VPKLLTENELSNSLVASQREILIHFKVKAISYSSIPESVEAVQVKIGSVVKKLLHAGVFNMEICILLR
jgi:hypothetical protein